MLILVHVNVMHSGCLCIVLVFQKKHDKEMIIDYPKRLLATQKVTRLIAHHTYISTVVPNLHCTHTYAPARPPAHPPISIAGISEEDEKGNKRPDSSQR